MNKLILQAIGGLVLLVAVLGLALFISAGSFDYWQAWLYLGVFFAKTVPTNKKSSTILWRIFVNSQLNAWYTAWLCVPFSDPVSCVPFHAGHASKDSTLAAPF